MRCAFCRFYRKRSTWLFPSVQQQRIIGDPLFPLNIPENYPTQRCKNTLMPSDLNLFRFMIMSVSSFTMSEVSKAHLWRTFSKCEAKLATAFLTTLILRMLCTPMTFYLTLTSLTQIGEGIMVDVSVTWKCVCSFSMWTRSKWKFGWRSNLMDEEL
jgi:hypothetical protein